MPKIPNWVERVCALCYLGGLYAVVEFNDGYSDETDYYGPFRRLSENTWSEKPVVWKLMKPAGAKEI